MDTTTTSPAPSRTLGRTRDDALVLGVCGGIGRAVGVAPVWPRLAAIALGVAVPSVALITYALLGVVVRRDDGRAALGGEPRDERETGIGWFVALLAGFVALRAGGGVYVGAPSPVLLAVAAAAGVVALTAGRAAPDAPGIAAARADAAETATLHPAAATSARAGAEPADPPPAPRPGPSLLLVGVAVLFVLAVATVLVNPVALLALGPGSAVATGAGVLGLLALGGVTAAIAFSGRRHAGGLLALALLVGLLAVGLASIADDAGRIAGSEPVVEWTLRRAADLVRLQP